jgi:hypothetical protein
LNEELAVNDLAQTIEKNRQLGSAIAHLSIHVEAGKDFALLYQV